MEKFKATIYKNREDRQGKPVSLTWDEFEAKISNPKEYESKDEQACIIFGQVDGSRAKKNLRHNTAIAIDIDSGNKHINEVELLLKKACLRSYIYTTGSYENRAGKYKMRVVLPLTAPISEEDRIDYVGRVNAELGGILHNNDSFHFRVSYIGKVAGRDYEYRIIPGTNIDDMPIFLMPEPVYPPCFNPQQVTNYEARDDLNKLLKSDGVDDLKSALTFLGERGHADTYSTWADIGLMLKASYDADIRIDNNEPELKDLSDKPYVDKSVYFELYEHFSQLGKPGSAENWTGYDPARGVKDWERLVGAESSCQAIFKKAQLLGWLNPAKKVEKQPEKTKGFTLTALSDYPDNDPPESWLIRNVLPEGRVGFMNGASSSGKSFIAIELAWHVAHGLDWNGNRVKTAGDVIYVAGEDAQGVRKRFRGLAKRHNAQRPNNIFLSDKGLSLFNKDDAELLAETIDTCTFNPRLIIVDTFHRNYGGDENSSADIKIFFDNIEEIQRKYNATILVIHHLGHGDQTRARGSSSIKASLDFEFLVSKKDGIINLEFTKTKNQSEENSRPMAFRLTDIETGLIDIDDEIEYPEVTGVLNYLGEADNIKPEKLHTNAKKYLDTLVNITKSDCYDWLPEADDGQVGREPKLVDEFGVICKLIPNKLINETFRELFPEISDDRARKYRSDGKLRLIKSGLIVEIDGQIAFVKTTFDNRHGVEEKNE